MFGYHQQFKMVSDTCNKCVKVQTNLKIKWVHKDTGSKGTQQHERNGHDLTNNTRLKFCCEGIAQGYCLSPTQPQLELGVRKLLGGPPTPPTQPTQKPKIY